MSNIYLSYGVECVAQRLVSKRVEIIGLTLLYRRRTVCIVMSEKSKGENGPGINAKYNVYRKRV